MKKVILLTFTVCNVLSFSLIAQTTIDYNGCDIYTVTDPITGNPVDDPQKIRSMWVNDFADWNSNSEPEEDFILCRGDWLSNDNLFEEEKDFLEYVTASTSNEGASVKRLLLYSVTFLLDNRNSTFEFQSNVNVPSSVDNMTLEQHFARFISIAKNEYDLEIQVVLPKAANHDLNRYQENNYNLYDFTQLNSSYLAEFNEFHGDYQGGDPCIEITGPGFTVQSGKKNTSTQGDEGDEWLWSYYNVDDHETAFPIDDEGNMHPFDRMRKNIWNIRVFQEKYPNILEGIRSNHLDLVPWEPHCAIDRVLPEIEFWQDKTDLAGTHQQGDLYRINDAFDMTITVLDYANCASELLQYCGFEVDAWVSHFTSYSNNPTGNSYAYYDINNNQPYHPVNTNINTELSEEIELRVSEVYVDAFNNDPCRTYLTPGGTQERQFSETAKLFCNNSWNLLNSINPTFNTRYESWALGDFLSSRTPADPFDGTFGKVEVVFNNDMVNDGFACEDDILHYSWYRRSEAFDLPFYKKPAGIEEKNNYSVSVYPNPASREINISYTGTDIPSTSKFNLYDIHGRELLRDNMSENHLLDVSEITPGIYLLKVDDEVKRIVIQR